MLTTTYSAEILSAFGEGGKNFSIYCNIGDFLLAFLKVITTANIWLALFSDSYPSRDVAYYAVLAEVVDRRFSVKQKKKNTLYTKAEALPFHAK